MDALKELEELIKQQGARALLTPLPRVEAEQRRKEIKTLVQAIQEIKKLREENRWLTKAAKIDLAYLEEDPEKAKLLTKLAACHGMRDGHKEEILKLREEISLVEKQRDKAISEREDLHYNLHMEREYRNSDEKKILKKDVEIKKLREGLKEIIHFHFGKCQQWKDGDDCFKPRHGQGNRICSVCQARELLKD